MVSSSSTPPPPRVLGFGQTNDIRGTNASQQQGERQQPQRRVRVWYPPTTLEPRYESTWCWTTGSTPRVGKATQFSLETPRSYPENGENGCCSGSYSSHDTSLLLMHTHQIKHQYIHVDRQGARHAPLLTARAPPPAQRRDPGNTVQQLDGTTKTGDAVMDLSKGCSSPPSLVVQFRLDPFAPPARPTLIIFR